VRTCSRAAAARGGVATTPDFAGDEKRQQQHCHAIGREQRYYHLMRRRDGSKPGEHDEGDQG
jgi:hypothetical protein